MTPPSLQHTLGILKMLARRSAINHPSLAKQRLAAVASSAAIVFLVLPCGFCQGAETPSQSASRAKPWVSLFDGKTLAGWTVAGCQATVQDGAILLESGNGVLQSNQAYRDFVLEVEWKALKPDAWDSGIFFRAGDPPAGRPWPKDYQVNLRKGMEGNVGNLKDAHSEGLTRPGEWNHFKLTVVGTTAALQINGQPAWKADGLELRSGPLALQAEVPNGGQFLFRKIRIQELDPKR